MQAGDIMTRNVVTASEDMPVRDAARLLGNHRISGLPVCDGAGHMVGLVSEFDLLSAPDGSAPVRSVMTRDVISVMENTSVDDVRFLLLNHKIRRLPVLSGQRLVGIVSRADLVREIALSWVCQVCGDHERGPNPPEVCPKCGVPSGFQPSTSPPVGEGADTPQRTCPTCGQRWPGA